MTQQGAALQNYNNELVKCERPAGPGRRGGAVATACGPASRAAGVGARPGAGAGPRTCQRHGREGGGAARGLGLELAPLDPAPLNGAAGVRPGVAGIEELCQKREELSRQIQQEEDEKQRLQNEVRQLTEKLARVNENLARKIASRNEFDRTIAETEAAYLKILESSQTLLSVLKREAGNLSKATASDQKSSGGKDS
ncbi:Sjoegren syndrome nuclear autoantigen 1 [Galemys pyrenaicus]|uniref:Sjoegren syndrome nuclear autoantigen 1 n=1 Tax=Galemys pyrenaicus TaxID=202257 RepID=A0A8J6ACQ6_GALPY|nr:Sjoegren syndrome nuclear autoantigen 1 [Galemys pyrenaicus]